VTLAVVGLAVAIAVVTALSVVVGFILGVRSATRQCDRRLETIIDSADRALADRDAQIVALDSDELERQRREVEDLLRRQGRPTGVN